MFKDNSILIIVVYEGSPHIHLCLNSILEAVEPIRNWHVAFINLSVNAHGVESLEDKFRLLKRYSIYDVPVTSDEVENSGGILAYALNRAIMANNDLDIATIVRDCDELRDRYLSDLNNYFACTTQTIACYSHVVPKANQFLMDRAEIRKHPLNGYHQPLSRTGLDGLHLTQIAWRLSASKEQECIFEFPSDYLEQHFYDKLYSINGAVPCSGMLGHVFTDKAPSSMTSPEVSRLLSQAYHALNSCDFSNAKRLALQTLELYPNNKKAKAILATSQYTG